MTESKLDEQINSCVRALIEDLLRTCDNAEAPTEGELDPAGAMNVTALTALTTVFAIYIERVAGPGRVEGLFRDSMAQVKVDLMLRAIARLGGLDPDEATWRGTRPGAKPKGGAPNAY